MNDVPPNRETGDFPEAVAEPRRRHVIQLVWIVPIIAALIGATLAVRSCIEQGRTITITFRTGEGLEAGKTKIKYKEVEIGKVKSMAIAKDRSHVIVTAQLTREANGLLVEDTKFWVVRPRIHGGNVSGLGTLMGGAYIGIDAGKSTKEQRAYQGLEIPPVVSMNEPGSRFILRANDLGSISIGSPIFFRRVEVGQVVAFELDKQGGGVLLTVFVKSPFDQFVRSNTLFWQASGIDVNLSASGVRINTESLVSILVGGIAFQPPEDGDQGLQVGPSSVFTMFASKDEAMKHATVAESFVLLLQESVRGLSVGAPVDFRGVTLGEVAGIRIEFDRAKNDFTIPVAIRLYPDRLRGGKSSAAAETGESRREFLTDLVNRGLRAQLKSGNVLTGQLHISLDFFPKAPKAGIDWNKTPPVFPTVHAKQEELQASLMRIAKKIEKMPLQEIATDARQAVKSLDDTLKSADALIKRVNVEIVPEARGALEEAHKTLDAAKEVLSADAPVHQDLRETLRELGRAAQAVRVLADYLEQHPESLLRGKKEEKR